MLQCCMKSKALRPGKQIHGQLLAIGTQMETGTIPSKLLGMYAGCGDVRSASQVFEYMRKPTVFAWNWMISALAFQGHCESAIGYFRLMQKNEAFPNKFTFSFVLKACVGLMDIKKGKELHCVINRMGFQTDISVVNALIDMYCKCGRLDIARKLFDKMTEKDVASWTSMICGYSHSGNLEESQILIERMGSEGLEPNDFTWNAMISGYAHSGHCSKAFELFSSMTSRGLAPDLVTWNAMIAGLVRSNRNVEAITLFSKMLTTGLKPNPVTIAGLLPACGSSGSIHIGKQVHGLINRRLLQLNIFTASALIDMYSKCGCVRDARSVFDQIEVKNVASWNAMIGCYGKHGLADASILLFERMNEEGLQANHITYTCLLSACSHAGLVEKGLRIFKTMEENENVELCKEHYACMVDLLSRAGKLEEAYELINKMPMEITDSIIGAFFNGCRIHGESNIAKKMAQEILGMELRKPGGFVTLSNIYAADGEWEWVENVRKVMKEKGVCKKAGFSWVENKDGIIGLKV
ncbi:hypothetical protein AQUCO_00900164v1 [Aquilegia coerulea]|uniref:Pentacotripeptide-repeat region of PRORP domain-containing protein n=1 Tax=Aquilegia coerulea TaxID=218851 RepID=A0A2G5ECA5_AQUCA|nr:hypothetical protein AQUCO_00900164v1 [Aquilegia coerulea]